MNMNMKERPYKIYVPAMALNVSGGLGFDLGGGGRKSSKVLKVEVKIIFRVF